VQEITVDGDVVFSAGPDPGTHFYIGDNGVQHYVLSTPYDLTSATQTSSLSQFDNPSFNLKPDGSRIWVRDNNVTTINQFDLTTPFDLNTATNQTNFTGFTQNRGGMSGQDFAAGGTVFYVGNGIDPGFYEEYTLTTPYDLNTRTLTDSSVTLPQAFRRHGGGFVFSPDGTRVIYGEAGGNDQIFQDDLSTPFDFNSASQDTSFTAESVDPTGIAISNDGTKLFARHASPNEVTEYQLSTPFDISSESFVQRHFTNIDFSSSITFNGNPWQV
jgi:hypothetical protein